MKTRVELYVNFDTKTIGYRTPDARFLHRVGDSLRLNSGDFMVYANFDLEDDALEVFKQSFKPLCNNYRGSFFCEKLNKVVEGLIDATKRINVNRYLERKEEVRRINMENSVKFLDALMSYYEM